MISAKAKDKKSKGAGHTYNANAVSRTAKMRHITYSLLNLLNIYINGMKAKYINPFTDFGFKKFLGKKQASPCSLTSEMHCCRNKTKSLTLILKIQNSLDKRMRTEEPFMTFIVKMKMEKNLLSNFRKPNRITLKKGLFIILLFQYGNKRKKAAGIII